MANKNLATAKSAKNDEFYTQLADIEKEMKHYWRHFEGAVIFCNCNNPDWSNFWKYFYLNFEKLGLKKLISTHYDTEKSTYKLEYDGTGEPVKTPLEGNGDFRSAECVRLLEESDIVITNPPFSLFREYISRLMEYKKKFIVLGNQNAITYKEIFPLLKDNKIWLGYKFGDMAFKVPDYYEPRATRYWVDKSGQKWRSMGNICWYTNLDITKRREDLILYKQYSPEEFPTYDNYVAINVNKICDIPMDYDGVMGVPITFMDKYNPDQFEIIGSDYEVKNGELPWLIKKDWTDKLDRGYINGKRIYSRLLIRNKKVRKAG